LGEASWWSCNPLIIWYFVAIPVSKVSGRLYTTSKVTKFPLIMVHVLGTHNYDAQDYCYMPIVWPANQYLNFRIINGSIPFGNRWLRALRVLDNLRGPPKCVSMSSPSWGFLKFAVNATTLRNLQG
jgi:hypothetical protein